MTACLCADENNLAKEEKKNPENLKRGVSDLNDWLDELGSASMVTEERGVRKVGSHLTFSWLLLLCQGDDREALQWRLKGSENFEDDLEDGILLCSFFVWSVCVPAEVAAGEGRAQWKFSSGGYGGMVSHRLPFLSPKGPGIEVFLLSHF